MKHLLLLICAFSLTFNLKAQTTSEDQITTYYLIRHAEKETVHKSNKNPELSKEGAARAEKWRVMFEEIDLDAVYSTNYTRTISTATPTAQSKGLDLIFYDPQQMDVQSLLVETKGKSILIVGHSNTTPSFVNSILGSSKYQNLDHHEYGKLFIVNVVGEQVIDQVLVID
ncbi:MAG: histidine phosphatase family protein [Psychroserpens sp.]|nr:histidine phosphatase family protein [Psychroserpens sp.]